MKIKTLLIAAALVMPVSAWADNCPNLMQEIDEILAATPDLDEETIVDEDAVKSVKQLREEGKKAHEEGRHDESVELLEKTLKLLSEQL